MIRFLLAAAVYTAVQGSAVQLEMPHEPRVNSVQVRWQTKKVPAFQAGDVWTTILGVDLNMKRGQHRAEALLTRDDGHVERREITVDVVAKKYPTRQLRVDERFVRLSEADQNRVKRESREVAAIY